MNHFESIYWVFTQLCNDRCDHCYNDSGPQGTRISIDECLAVVGNLPSKIDRLILSGGEPLTERAKLYAILDAVRARYKDATQIMLQTNGDLLDGTILDELIARGVTRIDIASIDRYHKHGGARRGILEELFRSRGMVDDATKPLIEKDAYLHKESLSYGFWGANEDFWIGGNWARGQAMRTGTWLRNGRHNFCAVLSGARGFLGGTELPQEISIQLWKINPCCPGTLHPMGDARTERVADVIERVAKSPIFQKLNEGDPYAMGESIGISRDQGVERAVALENVCLWCDEFFERHFDMRTLASRTSR
ncbi:MAG TPA: radical SAM protein [Thermoanaerobaculia bacterium]|nr:radical SAM protein [Thermoanaerobaculia bacterium]